MSYKEQQQQWLEEHQVTEGTRVRVVARLDDQDGETYGWPNDWTDPMNGALDREGVVISIHPEAGITVGIPGIGDYYYPYFVLETVGDPQLESAIAEFQSETA